MSRQVREELGAESEIRRRVMAARDARILKLLADGLSPVQVGARMSVDPSTVRRVRDMAVPSGD